MSLNNPLADALVHIMNCERIAKSECIIKPSSKIIKDVLNLLKKEKYVGDFEKDYFEKFEKRYLPSKELGFLIVSTSKGLMTNIEAKQKKLGGRLIAYVY